MHGRQSAETAWKRSRQQLVKKSREISPFVCSPSKIWSAASSVPRQIESPQLNWLGEPSCSISLRLDGGWVSDNWLCWNTRASSLFARLWRLAGGRSRSMASREKGFWAAIQTAHVAFLGCGCGSPGRNRLMEMVPLTYFAHHERHGVSPLSPKMQARTSTANTTCILVPPFLLGFLNGVLLQVCIACCLVRLWTGGCGFQSRKHR